MPAEPAPAPTAVPRSSRRLLSALLLAGLAACALYLAAEVYLLGADLGFPLDDSWIHLQFARNLAGGDGLSYNPGERVTGSTAPLWTGLLSLLLLLPGSAVLWAKALGAGLYLAGIHATFRLARELDLPAGLAALATTFSLATGWLVWSALSGMEVPLFILLSLWGMILHLRERRAPGRPPLSLGVLALSVLARPEGALLLLLAVADRLLAFHRRDPRPSDGLRLQRPELKRLALGVLLALAILAGPLALYAWVGGTVLPTTFSAKGSGVQRWLPELGYLQAILGIFFRPQPWMTLLAGGGVLVLLERLGSRRDRGLLPALWMLGLPLAYSLMTPVGHRIIAGNFGRYYFPLFPVLAILGTLGLERVAAAVAPGLRLGHRRLSLTAPLLLVLLWPTASNLVRSALDYASNVADVHGSDVRMARFLAERLPPEAVLAVNDIGAFKYFMPNRIVDLVGIASPEIRGFLEARQARGMSFYEAVVEFLADRRPDYVVIFPTWLPPMSDDGRFPPVYYLPIPDNRTMGGDDMVVFATPWTRYPLAEPAAAARRPGDPIPVGGGSGPLPVPRSQGATHEDPADRSLPR